MSSAPPSPSRHDPWRFLRCVWIYVITIAYSLLGGRLLLWLKSWLATLALLSPAAIAPLGACRALAACWLELMATPATCPLALGARSLAESGPYFALGRVFYAEVRLCSGPALTTRGRHTQRLVCPTWARDRVRFCAGRMISARLALTLRWAESSPLLRWAQTL